MGRPDSSIRIGDAPRAGRTGLLVAVAVAFAAAAAFGVGLRLGRSHERAAPADSARLEARLAALDEALASERAARGALELEIAELRALAERSAAAAAPEPPDARAAGAEASPPAEDTPAPLAEASAEPDPAATLFDLEALVAGCMDRRDADRLRARWERYELDRLELNDRARREGFFMTPQHRDEHLALDSTFREDVGEDGYEAYLRATGKPNGVAVKALLPSGAGRGAGLEVGDHVLTYAGERVFAASELQQLTAAGRPGEGITIEILRGGQPLTLRAPRGPLGIVLEPVRRARPGGC